MKNATRPQMRALLTKHGISQRKLAGKMGISESWLCSILSGRHNQGKHIREIPKANVQRAYLAALELVAQTK